MKSRYYASFEHYTLQFKKPAGTSRGFLKDKQSWFLKINDRELNAEGIGECSIIPGISIDNESGIPEVLEEICTNINESGNFDISEDKIQNYPAIKFALESALLDLNGGGNKILFHNTFSEGEKGIPINGLVWMADPEDMFRQATEKIESGYTCIKFKIGALDFNSELALLKKLRETFGYEFMIRLDANGAFKSGEAIQKIIQLSEFQIHSLEQPIAAGQWKEMANLCRKSPIDIALDEELIAIYSQKEKTDLILNIKPQYLIIKPSLIGGFEQAETWIGLAESHDIGWWATSALESNIGLNAIAQWTAEKNPLIPQGLGTGSLYVNNFTMPLKIDNGQLWFKRGS